VRSGICSSSEISFIETHSSLDIDFLSTCDYRNCEGFRQERFLDLACESDKTRCKQAQNRFQKVLLNLQAARLSSNHLSSSSLLNRHWRPNFTAGIPKIPMFSRIHHGLLFRNSAASSVVISLIIITSFPELTYASEYVRLSLIKSI
jgi:hypothetical protein